MEKDNYDMAATVFSPDGRVYQVEYAREAINRGGLAMGIMFKDGILFTIDKSIFSPLVEEDNLEKFFPLSNTINWAWSVYSVVVVFPTKINFIFSPIITCYCICFKAECSSITVYIIRTRCYLNSGITA